MEPKSKNMVAIGVIGFLLHRLRTANTPALCPISIAMGQRGESREMDYFDYLWALYDKAKADYFCGRIEKFPPFPLW